MSARKRRDFIAFSATPSWSDPAELWEYFWCVYRIAEPQNDRTNAGDAFVKLMTSTQGRDRNWTFTGDAIRIKREDLYDIVEPCVRRAKSNYLIESKPPHKFLRRLVTGETLRPTPPRQESNEVEFPVSLAALFHADPANTVVLRRYFGTEDMRFDFRGFPMIGWTREDVWFGTTDFGQLWLQAPDVRAKALEYPFKALPKFLNLAWSPVPDDWRPLFERPEWQHSGASHVPSHPSDPAYTLDPVSGPEFRTKDVSDYPTSRGHAGFVFNRVSTATALFDAVGEWEPLSEPRAVGTRLATRVSNAPEVRWIASSHDQVRTALVATEEHRHGCIFSSAVLVTPLPIESVAENVHIMQARSNHPVRFSYLPDGLLLKYVRHFPWTLYPGAKLRLRGDSLPGQLLMTCFLEAWRMLRPFVPRATDARACWRTLQLPGDFDALVQELAESGMVEISRDAIWLQEGWFGPLLPTKSASTELADRVEDWFLEQSGLHTVAFEYKSVPNRKPKPPNDDKAWCGAVQKIVRRATIADVRFEQIARPYRAVHALEIYVERFPSDADATEKLAVLHLGKFDIHRGLLYLNRLRDQHREEHAHRVVETVIWDTYYSIPRDVDRIVQLLGIQLRPSGHAVIEAPNLSSLEDVNVLRSHPDERVRAFASRFLNSKYD